MKSNGKYWQEFLRRYRVSKSIRDLRSQKGLRLRDLANTTGYTRQYINNVQEILLKPSQDFINKLERLEHENP